MRSTTESLLLLLIVIALRATVCAQQQTVNAGAVTKYTGTYTQADQVQQSRDFLSTLEAQLAASFARSSGIEYVDRSNLQEIFREKRLASGDEFDPSTGALRGLLGKLDYLIVIEASASSTARLRVIDVETGAVKATSICENPSAIARLFSSSRTPACISSLVDQTLMLAKGRLAVKKDRALKEANERREAENKVAEEERKRAEEQRRSRLQTAAEQREAERRIEEEEQNRVQAEAEVSKVRPRYDDVMARVSSEDTFWQHMDAQLHSSGHSLRSEVRSLLGTVHSKADQCGQLLTSLKAADANACLDQLDKQLDALDQYK
jgi:hypothetical protein